MIIDGFLILVYAMAFYYYKHLIDLHFENKNVKNTLFYRETGRKRSL